MTITAVLVPTRAATPAHLEISVHDDGPGLPSSLQHVVFDKFVTGDSKQSGNGLGLAFCQMALAAHGERIWVHSAPGQGATFTFTLSPTLPAEETAAAETVVAASVDPGAGVKTAVADPLISPTPKGVHTARPHPKMAFNR